MMKLKQLFAILDDTSESTYHRCGIVLLVLLSLSIVAQWAVSPVPLSATPQDIMIQLDAGWRVYSGQVPHNDFYSGLGPAFSFIYAIGVWLFGPTISAIVNTNLMVMAVVTLLAWIISRHRFSPLLALLFSATVMMTTSGVEPLGWGADKDDYAMSYTREAYGILMCISAGCFFPAREHVSKIVAGAEDVLIGALVSFLLLLKINFFVIATLAIVISPYFEGFSPRRFAWTGLGFLLPVLIFWLLLGVSPDAFFNDMTLMYEVAKESRPPILQTIWTLILNLALPLSVVLLMIVATGYISSTTRSSSFPHIARSLSAVLFLLIADLLLGISNSQLPILVFMPLIALIVLRELLMLNGPRSLGHNAMIILTLLLGTYTVIRESSYIGYAFWRKHSANPVDVKAQRFNSPLLKNVYVPSGIDLLSYYPLIVNDGLTLLKKHVSPENKLVSLSFSNPFNFLLGLQPATGDSLWWHEEINFTAISHPPAERVFSDADFIVIDINQRPTQDLVPIYRHYIQQHFALIDRSKYWLLLKRFSP